MYNMSEVCCNVYNVVRLHLVSVDESRACTLMVRGPRHSSLSGVPYGCARLPINRFCIFPINLMHLVNCMRTQDWVEMSESHDIIL